MRRNRRISGRKNEQGVVMLLVAIFLLFVVGAMAVLAIDVVTFYTARSEAQLAADGAALAGARAMANSGSTSDPIALESFARTIATTAATNVAIQNKIGGRNVTAAEVNVSFPLTPGVGYNPRVEVEVTRSDLPTFFARIWGSTQVTVKASATAEAYNPSGSASAVGASGRIAPVCTKPWLLPNLVPVSGNPIFNANGTIFDNTIVGNDWVLTPSCGDCSGPPPLPAKVPQQYYPGAIGAGPNDFPVPTQSLPTGSALFNPYQLAVAGCVRKPIACGAGAALNVDTSPYGPSRDPDTVQAVKVLIHDTGTTGDSDSIDTAAIPNPPFQYLAGNANPITNAVGKDVLVTDSLVTVPVFDSPNPTPVSPVQVIGFLQLFLNRTGTPLAGPGIPATIVNMAGCGTTATGQAVLGTGASAIPVRLVSQ